MPIVMLDFDTLTYAGSGDFAYRGSPISEESFFVHNPNSANFGTLRSSAGFNRHDLNDDTPFADGVDATRRSTIVISHTAGESFDLLSLELDSLITGQVGSVAIVGTLAGGGTVETVVTLDAVNSSQTFALPDTFRNLTSVSVVGPERFQFDDIVLRDYDTYTDGADVVNVASAPPTFIRALGGNDTVSFAAGTFEISDNVIVDGGSGSDTLALTGGQTLTLGAGPVQNITNFEVLALGGGTFNVTMADGFLTALQTLTVTATTLTAAQTLTLNASAETFARYVVSSGAGNDTVILGAGNDEISTGGGGNDLLDGGPGDDTIVGGANDDHLLGGTGQDQLFGSSGVDLLEGGDGEDILDGGSGQDVVHGGAGNDTISDAGFDNDQMFGGSGNDLMFAFEGMDLMDGGADNDTMFAGDDNDTVYGGSGDDTMDGGANEDLLDGGPGVDTMTGGSGNDTFIVDSNNDITNEANLGGTDRVAALTSYALAAGTHIELLDAANLSSTSALNLAGNELNQTIIGNNGANVLSSGGGTDVMYGHAGNDTFLANAGAASTMVGSVGDDVYFVAHGSDVVQESSGQGTDRVAAGVSYVLTSGSSVEILETTTMSSITAINLTGNALNQTIIGNNGTNVLNSGGGNDHLIGAGGSDTLIGSASASTMEGGPGDDVYFVSDGSDLVVELAGGGNDRIAAHVSYTLAASSEVETLEAGLLSATSALNFTGNAFVNTLIGNNGANVLDGKDSGDVLVGAGGNDTFAFTTGLGGGNIDRIDGFVSGADKIALDDAVFSGIAPGALAAGAFTTGGAATDADDRIIYNPATGALFYDPDGTGAAAAVQFATLPGGPALVGGDFVLI